MADEIESTSSSEIKDSLQVHKVTQIEVSKQELDVTPNSEEEKRPTHTVKHSVVEFKSTPAHTVKHSVVELKST
ncbi:8442_t:CDS:2, partial [Ambispora gerdemannii]